MQATFAHSGSLSMHILSLLLLPSDFRSSRRPQKKPTPRPIKDDGRVPSLGGCEVACRRLCVTLNLPGSTAVSRDAAKGGLLRSRASTRYAARLGQYGRPDDCRRCTLRAFPACRSLIPLCSSTAVVQTTRFSSLLLDLAVRGEQATQDGRVCMAYAVAITSLSQPSLSPRPYRPVSCRS